MKSARMAMILMSACTMGQAENWAYEDGELFSVDAVELRSDDASEQASGVRIVERPEFTEVVFEGPSLSGSLALDSLLDVTQNGIAEGSMTVQRGARTETNMVSVTATFQDSEDYDWYHIDRYELRFQVLVDNAEVEVLVTVDYHNNLCL